MKKILLIILSVILLLGISSAMNSKEYNPYNKEITLKDGTTSLAEIKLTKNTDFCINYCFAEGKLNLYTKSKLIDNIKFNKIEEGQEKSIARDYKISIKQNGRWLEYKAGTLQPGVYYWKIEGWKEDNESIDWIPTILGTDINEWAWWRAPYDWNDDFEVATINASLWTNTTATGGSGGAYGLATIAQQGGTDGSVAVSADAHGNGNTGSAVSSFRSTQNFNDLSNYRIEFTINKSGTGQAAYIEIGYGGSYGNADTGTDINGKTIYSLASGTVAKGNYVLVITSGDSKANLYNSTFAKVGSVALDSGQSWYLQLRTGSIDTGTLYSSISLFNVTVKRYAPVVLNSPSANNQSLILNYLFNATINSNDLIVGGSNITNASLYIWNRDGSLYMKNTSYSYATFNGLTGNYINTTFTPTYNFTFCAWIKSFSPSVAATDILAGFNRSVQQASLGVLNGRFLIFLASSGYLYSNTYLTADTWTHICAVVTQNVTFSQIYFNGGADNGVISKTQLGKDLGQMTIGSELSGFNFNGSIDEVRIWNRSLSSTEVSQLYAIGQTENASILTDGLQLYFPMSGNLKDMSGNNHNGSVKNNVTFKTPTTWNITLPRNRYTWNVLAFGENRTTAVSMFAENNRTLDLGFIENNQSYNASTYSRSPESFVINLSYASSYWTSIVAVLYYNNTAYSGIKTGTGDSVLFTRGLTIPSVSSATNVSFFWSITLSNGSNTVYYNTSIINQSISIINLSSCSSGTTFLTLNVKDENTGVLLDVNATTLAFNLQYYHTSISESERFNATITSNNVSLCFSPAWGSIKIFGEIEYSSTSYVKEYYYILYDTFTNSTTTIDLYDLPAVDSTSYINYLYYSDSSPVEGAYMLLKRQYTGENDMRTVEVARTDESGIGILHYISEDQVYQLEFYDSDGYLLYTTNKFRAACLDTICQMEWQLPFSSELNPFQGLTEDPNFVRSLTLVDDIITFTFNSVNGTGYDILFETYGIDVVNSTLRLCSQTDSDAALGSYSCNVSSYNYGTYLVKVWVDGDLEIIEYLTITNDEWEDFGRMGLIYAVFIVVVLALLFAWWPEFSIAGSVVGLLFSMWMHFIPGTIVTASWLIVGVVYIIGIGGKE